MKDETEFTEYLKSTTKEYQIESINTIIKNLTPDMLELLYKQTLVINMMNVKILRKK